jgi:hypothetical protein
MEFDDLQERFNESQRELVQLKKAFNKLNSMNLWDRLRNRVPEDLKEETDQLKEKSDNLKDKTN